jgi:hypothetical protein
MTRLRDARGISPEDLGRLKDLGITTSEDLLARGAAFEGRETIAAQTGIAEITITRWVGIADLERLNGVAWDYATLLSAAGIGSIPELGLAQSELLLTRLADVNQSQQIVKRLPTTKQVQSWIEAAKQIPGVLSYRPQETF